MRLDSAYFNIQAAKDVNSIFQSEMQVKKIYKDGDGLWELIKKEEKDDIELDNAEKNSEINEIIKDEKQEIKDIESLANQTFKIIRDGILLIHTQLDKLKRIKKDDEILEHSGFPIEIANQLEEMLTKEIKIITSHLQDMNVSIQKEEKNAEEENYNS
jgi:hypothetical protein